MADDEIKVSKTVDTVSEFFDGVDEAINRFKLVLNDVYAIAQLVFGLLETTKASSSTIEDIKRQCD